MDADMVFSSEDAFGIVYLIETPQQFWSELEDVVSFSSDTIATLSLLDSSLRRYISLCASYHERYLQNPLQLQHACDILSASELLAFHSERMCDNLVEDIQATTDPHVQYIIYAFLLHHGLKHHKFLRSQKHWQKMFPLLLDHVLVDVDSTDAYSGSKYIDLHTPIETQLRNLSVTILYEVCRVQKMTTNELKAFTDTFLDHIFDLVEQTKEMHDESFNYSCIKLLAAFNEQFMVAALPGNSAPINYNPQDQNRVLRVLLRRVGSSRTFGENLIFMLNRASRSDNDLTTPLLILKVLYVLFTTKGTSEYFYTNDLCVLVDIILREVSDLDTENESLRHTYLRVLHPLLTKTQLRNVPYKRPQILYTLESIMGSSPYRDTDPTTKRLIQRCLSTEWGILARQLAAQKRAESLIIPREERSSSPCSDLAGDAIATYTPKKLNPIRSLKGSRSVQDLSITKIHAKTKPDRPPRRGASVALHLSNSNSTVSLPMNVDPNKIHQPRNSKSAGVQGAFERPDCRQQIASRTESLVTALEGLPLPSTPDSAPLITHRRTAPPIPVAKQRRKPPAIPSTAHLVR